MNICTVAQNGRLMYEVCLLLLSYNHFNINSKNKFYICIPKNSEKWSNDPSKIPSKILKFYEKNGAIIKYFDNEKWGEEYPHSNKIYALSALPKNENFLFLDSDNFVTNEINDELLDFTIPSAQLEGNTFPTKRDGLYNERQIWNSLYSRFSLNIDKSCKFNKYDYFNAGAFYYKCPIEFFELYLKYCIEIWDNPPPELKEQKINPWLDQICLPLVINKLDGERSAMPEGINFRVYEKHQDLSKIDHNKIITFHYHSLYKFHLPGMEQMLDKLMDVCKGHDEIFSENEYFTTYLFKNKISIDLRSATKYFQLNRSKNKITEHSIERKKDLPDQLRDIAISLENKNLSLSLALMQVALDLRPNGPYIKQKINEYKEKIN